MINNNNLINNIWHNNPAFSQLLGLCPLLAVSNTLLNSFFLGLATLIVLILSNGIIASVRHIIPTNLRMPFFVLIIASLVTTLQMLLQAYAFSLQESLGLFLALITTNCVILARVEACAYKNNIIIAIQDGFLQGLGFLLAIILLGAIRELLGTGNLANINIIPNFSGILLAILPPGAFIITGLLLAAKNYCQQKYKSPPLKKGVEGISLFQQQNE
jgi:electron transport complex protein RnfE